MAGILRPVKGRSHVNVPLACFSLVVVGGLCGVLYAAYNTHTERIPKKGIEKSVNFHLNSPYGSLALASGTGPEYVAQLDVNVDDPTGSPEWFLHYGLLPNNIGNLHISIGSDEGQLHQPPPIAMWHAGNPNISLRSANFVYGDNGSAYSYGQESALPNAPSLREEALTSKTEDYKARLFLTRDLPINMTAQLGFGESYLDLTGLSLERTYIETGASRVHVFMKDRNPVQMSLYQVSAGLGECSLNGICYSNAAKFEFDGGIGYYSLDFGGQLTHNMDATISVGLGKVSIFIPPQAGRVQVFYDDNLFSAYDFTGLAKRGNGYATSVGFDRSNLPTLTLHLSSGMGKMNIVYR